MYFTNINKSIVWVKKIKSDNILKTDINHIASAWVKPGREVEKGGLTEDEEKKTKKVHQ